MEDINLTVTIMAAGEGKRMNSNIPKVLHLFKGIPMLIRIILEVFKLNPNKIIVITGKYHDLIKETIDKYFEYSKDNTMNLSKHSGDKELFSGTLVKENIIYVQQKNPIGTGEAIKCTLNNYSNNENVLILNGDMPLITSSLLEKFIEYKLNNNKIMVAKLDNPFGYGRILYDNQNNFIGIKEEKDCNIEEKNIKIINVGIYFFHSLILKKYIPLIDNNNMQNEYYLTDIIKVIKYDKENLSENNIYTYCIEEKFKYQIMGVNTKDELINLENNFL
jgi:bifunctional N-acetylglucosamine-1-phosphate-uridyltransferase/glucosamine-1-phosphate-acetyltransferase GlmU-like protein